jgi:hypothetical protein
LTLRSKVKVPRRSLWYVTHRLMVMHPHNNYHWPIKRQTCYGPDKNILFKKQLFDLVVKGQGPTKVIVVCDTPPYGHAPTYQILLTYLERQKSYGPDKLRWEEAEEKIRLKQYVSLRSKGRHKTYDILKDTLLKIIFAESLPTRQIWSMKCRFKYLKQFLVV